jgi:hypothetical protein
MIFFVLSFCLIGTRIFINVDQGRRQSQARKNILSGLDNHYYFGGEVLIKRGLYAGCAGKITARNTFIYVLLLDSCNGLEKIYVQVHAQEFDDNTMKYINKFVK